MLNIRRMNSMNIELNRNFIKVNNHELFFERTDQKQFSKQRTTDGWIITAFGYLFVYSDIEECRDGADEHAGCTP